MTPTVRIFVTGGTFDKEYNERDGSLYFKDTHLRDMLKLARCLGEAGLPGKTIVLTGAKIPFAYGSSDGLFKLGAALAFAQSLPSGVYVAMNGRVFSWDNVRKNRDIGEFETLS